MANKYINELLKYNDMPYSFTSNFNLGGVWNSSTIYYENNGGYVPLAVNVGAYAQARNWGQPNAGLQGLYKNLPLIRPVMHEGYLSSYSGNETYTNNISVNLFCDHTSVTYDGSLFHARSTKGISICLNISSYAIYGSSVNLSIYQDNVSLYNSYIANIGLDCTPKLRWKILGNTLYVKYWLSGGEPTGFQVSVNINPSTLTYKDIEVMAGLTAYSPENPQHTINIYELTISNK